MLTQRQKQLLTMVIREYTDTGVPISSRALAKKFRLSLSPATLRAEFARLCEMGYLVQPHTSAGRVPTDRGYRYFIKQLMKPETVSPRERSLIRRNLLRKTSSCGRNIAKTISLSTRNLGLYFDPEEDMLYREGFLEVFRKTDFRIMSQVSGFVELLDILEEQILDFINSFLDEEAPMVLIGRNRLLPMQDDYSILYSGYSIGGRDYMIGAIGPKRMDYARNISILDFIRGEITRDHGRTEE